MPGTEVARRGRRSPEGTEVEGRRIIDAMNIDPTMLFLSMIPSGVGFVLFVYGKKEGRWPQLVVGLLLMVYPYFTPSLASMIGVGVLLGASLYTALQLGW